MLRRLYDADGNEIAGTRDDNGGTGRNASLTFTATETDTHYIEARGKRLQTGTYTVQVTDATPDLGDIQFGGDRDWFAVDLEAGKTYGIDLEGSDANQGTLYDPYLYGIHDASGNLIPDTANDDGGDLLLDSRLAFIAPETATNYIAAGAYRGETGTYKLSVTAFDDDAHSAERALAERDRTRTRGR